MCFIGTIYVFLKLAVQKIVTVMIKTNNTKSTNIFDIFVLESSFEIIEIGVDINLYGKKEKYILNDFCKLYK